MDKSKPISMVDALALQVILDSMDVPEGRKTDIRWLRRNLHIKNKNHPRFQEAEILMIKLWR